MSGYTDFYVGLADGSGGFNLWTWSRVAVTRSGESIWIADVNGDGKADLIHSNLVYGYVDFYVNLSTGAGFEASPSWSSMSLGRAGDSFWLVDVNGDGMADLVRTTASASDDGTSYVADVYVGLAT